VSNPTSEANIENNESLVARLEVNRKFAQSDFHSWVYERLAFQPGMDVLDVGCGNGAQALEALRMVGPAGSVSAVDISEKSVQQLRDGAGQAQNLVAVVGDMRNIEDDIRNRFRVKQYDLAYSVYSLWYGGDHIKILDVMRGALRPGGRLVVCVPNHPNGLRELVKRLGRPTPYWDQSTHFGTNVLEPYFRAYFYQVTIHLQKNVVRIPSVEEVLRFFRATGYYSPEVEPQLSRYVASEIEASGAFSFEKNNYLIEGRNAIAY
jgi:ubiquinone/menaquinone biosynthesis C-methylase UbiE